jgi:hypothetical protein
MVGTMIYSDKWAAYNGLLDEGFGHQTVNYSEEFKAEDGTHTNTVEGYWHQVKASLPTLLNSYFHEYTWLSATTRLLPQKKLYGGPIVLVYCSAYSTVCVCVL